MGIRLSSFNISSGPLTYGKIPGQVWEGLKAAGSLYSVDWNGSLDYRGMDYWNTGMDYWNMPVTSLKYQ